MPSSGSIKTKIPVKRSLAKALVCGYQTSGKTTFISSLFGDLLLPTNKKEQTKNFYKFRCKDTEIPKMRYIDTKTTKEQL